MNKSLPKFTIGERENIAKVVLFYYISELYLKKLKKILRNKKNIILPDDPKFERWIENNVYMDDSMSEIELISDLLFDMLSVENNDKVLKTLIENQNEYISFPEIDGIEDKKIRNLFYFGLAWAVLSENKGAINVLFYITNDDFKFANTIIDYSYRLAINSMKEKTNISVEVNPLSMEEIIELFNNCEKEKSLTPEEEKIKESFYSKFKEELGLSEKQLQDFLANQEVSHEIKKTAEQFFRTSSFRDLSIFWEGVIATFIIEYSAEKVYKKIKKEVLDFSLEEVNSIMGQKKFQAMIDETNRLQPTFEDLLKDIATTKSEDDFFKFDAFLEKFAKNWEKHQYTYFRDHEFVKRALRSGIDLPLTIMEYLEHNDEHILNYINAYLSDPMMIGMFIIKIAYAVYDRHQIKIGTDESTISEIEIALNELDVEKSKLD